MISLLLTRPGLLAGDDFAKVCVNILFAHQAFRDCMIRVADSQLASNCQRQLLLKPPMLGRVPAHRVIGTDRGDESSVRDILFMDKKTFRSCRHNQTWLRRIANIGVMDSFEIDLQSRESPPRKSWLLRSLNRKRKPPEAQTVRLHAIERGPVGRSRKRFRRSNFTREIFCRHRRGRCGPFDRDVHGAWIASGDPFGGEDGDRPE